MGYTEEYRRAKTLLEEQKCFWNPRLKTVIFPSGVVLWLGGAPDAPPTAFRLHSESTISTSTLARYAVTGKVPNNIAVVPVKLERMQEEAEAALGILDEIPGPYKDKLMCWLLPKT